MKEYIIYAGVNGAGKSTLYNLAPCTDCVRINTDEIVRSLGDWRDINLQLKAGKIAINKIKQCISEGISFNQEICQYNSREQYMTVQKVMTRRSHRRSLYGNLF